MVAIAPCIVAYRVVGQEGLVLVLKLPSVSDLMVIKS